MIYYIYKINFLCGNHAGCYYIGKRIHNTKHSKDTYTGSGKFCHRYFEKYGKIEGVTYTKEILCYCSSKEELAAKEREIIGNLYETDPLCMNLMEGGKGGALGEESCKKLSESKKGKHRSPETCKKISVSLKGKPHSEEHKQKISKSCSGEKNGMYGKHHSEETTKKMSITRKGRPSLMKGKHHTEEAKQKQREAHLGKPSPIAGKHKVYNPDGTYHYE